MITFSPFSLGASLRKGYFSLKISDQQFFSEPQLINIHAFSTQVIKMPSNASGDVAAGPQEQLQSS